MISKLVGTMKQTIIKLFFLLCFFIICILEILSSSQIILNFGKEKLTETIYLCNGLLIIFAAGYLFFDRFLSVISRWIFIHLLLLIFIAITIFMDFSEYCVWAYFAYILYGGYFNLSKWAVMGDYLNSFEIRNALPACISMSMVGWISSSLIIFTRALNIEITYYLGLIAIILVIILLLSISLSREDKAKFKEEKTPIRLSEIIKLFKDHTIFIWMTGFFIIINYLAMNVVIQTSVNFKEIAGKNLDMFYAGTGLMISISGTIMSKTFFKKFIKSAGLSNTMLGSTLAIMTLMALYIITRSNISAWILFLFYWMLLVSTIIPISFMIMNLYPYKYRSFLQVHFITICTVSGNILIVINEPLVNYVDYLIAVSAVMLILFGYLTKVRYDADFTSFLHSSDDTIASNAILVFDTVRRKKDVQYILETLNKKSQKEIKINIIEILADLDHQRSVKYIIPLLHDHDNEETQLACLSFFQNAPPKKENYFGKYQMMESLKNLCLSNSTGSRVKALAMKIFIQNTTNQRELGFIMKSLQSSDERMVADTIEAFKNIIDINSVDTIEPFMKSNHARIKANTIITLHKFEEFKETTKTCLKDMIKSGQHDHFCSGTYAIGELKLESWQDYLEKAYLEVSEFLEGTQEGDTNYLPTTARSWTKDQTFSALRIIVISLFKLGNYDHVRHIIDIIIGKDEKEAINYAYLVNAFDPEMLNEKIMGGILERGEAAVHLALHRFMRCGAKCYEQIKILKGEGELRY
tara:strand:- start:45 stop:2300 length:2256 start_codon:yes stop_codon:yes gene_type:complete